MCKCCFSEVHAHSAHDVFLSERLLRSSLLTLTINTQIWTSPWWHDAADRVPTVTMRGSISGGSVPSNQWPAPGDTPSTSPPSGQETQHSLDDGSGETPIGYICCSEWHEARCYAVTVAEAVCVVSLCAGNKVNHSPHAIATISSPPSSWHQQRIIDCSGGEHREHGHGSRSRDPGHWETRYNYRCKRLIGEVVQSQRRPLLGLKQKS